MFYWSYKEIHLVLSNEEEAAILQEVSSDPREKVRYYTNKKTRKELERRIFRYFEESLRADPDAFNNRFVFRSCYGEEAQRIFPVLLDGYGRITKRATGGLYGTRPMQVDIVENLYYAMTDKVFRITLLGKGRWPWSSPVVNGYISLPAPTIEKVTGTLDNFFVASSTATIQFARDHVRISLLDVNGALKNGTEQNNE